MLRSRPTASSAAPAARGVASSCPRPALGLSRRTACSSSAAGPAEQCSTSKACELAAQPVASPRNAAAKALVARARSCARRAGEWMRQARLQQLLFGDPSLGLGPQPLQLMAAVLVLPSLAGGGVNDLFTNRVFLAGFWAWFMAQTLKIFTKRLKKGVWDIRAIVDSGGMPSSHSALCAGITTAIAYEPSFGFGSTAFAMAVAFSSIVFYDAAGVRRHAGKQAEVLNQVIDELLEGHPVSDVKLKEVLGHTPLQVCAGAILGVVFGIFFPVPQPFVA